MSALNLAVQKPAPSSSLEIRLHAAKDLGQHLARWEAFVAGPGQAPLSRHPGWLVVLERGLRHVPYCIEAVAGAQTRGILPLAYVSSLLFGRFLVSLPYLNYGGTVADSDEVAGLMVERAIQLADQLKVRFLELRNEWALGHAKLVCRAAKKVHMRLALPDTSEKLWKQLDAKVRNQVRKGQKNDFKIVWGGVELLPDFYHVFSQNMRDLGTPVYGRKLFRTILEQFPGRAELCVVRAGQAPIASALLLHGWEITEVPSASSLRAYNSTCANMLLYWSLLERTVERKQAIFDFGRSSEDSSTFRFKKQWGAQPASAEWQYYLRSGTINDMRPDNPKYQRFIRLWQKLPLWLTQWLGPPLVRGIP